MTKPVRVKLTYRGVPQLGVVMPHEHREWHSSCPVRLDCGIWTAERPCDWTVVKWIEAAPDVAKSSTKRKVPALDR